MNFVVWLLRVIFSPASWFRLAVRMREWTLFPLVVAALFPATTLVPQVNEVPQVHEEEGDQDQDQHQHQLVRQKYDLSYPL